MKRQPLTQPAYNGASQVLTLGAPLGGLNTVDNLAATGKQYALQLDNVYPWNGQCVLRGGTLDLITCPAAAGSGHMNWLYMFEPSGGSARILAFGGNKAYAIDPVAPSVSTLKSSYSTGAYGVSATQITNSAGGHFIWVCNGNNDPFVWDGTTVTDLNSGSTPALTGLGSNPVAFVFLAHHRLWLLDGSTDAYYLPLDSIAGAAAKFPLGPLLERGSIILAGTTWTVDGGSGINDHVVFISAAGELIIYQGTDPSVTTTWSLVGTWNIGRPAGPQCFFRYGADIGVLTQAGVVLLSQILKSPSVNWANAITAKIANAWVTDVQAAKTSWQAALYPNYNALVLCGGVSTKQYVMNMFTGAWCTLSGQTIYSMLEYNGTLFIGQASGKISTFWGNLTSDNGSDIVGSVQQSFIPSIQTQQVQLVKPQISYDRQLEYRLGIAVDYAPGTITSTLVRLPDPGVSTPALTQEWCAPSARPGHAFSLLLQLVSKNSKVSWPSTSVMLSAGGLF